ncbi:CHAP domain-containing protein [Blastococcus sp. KM273129]|uniref:CHAP domain-containing protein n=1 Tax=Blastococcus sp. KM273129 TaxID=2570315 RepID=UPI001F2CFC1E|nr:CHAP domain-containing protein [Blastococcus sp. KM273129]MCF6736937.1 hypothetical protein [Blastococcus sp. KM273129]
MVRDGISRRAFLGAGAGALLLGGIAVVTSQQDGPPTTPGATTPTEPAEDPRPALADVLADADASAGVRLLGSQWAEWYGAPAEEWSALFISWLLRARGLPRTDDVAELYDFFDRADSLGDRPEVGALIFYADGPVLPYRVGLVTSVTDGVAQTMEGDHPVSLPPAERFVRRFARPWDAARITYAYPSYA